MYDPMEYLRTRMFAANQAANAVPLASQNMQGMPIAEPGQTGFRDRLGLLMGRGNYAQSQPMMHAAEAYLNRDRTRPGGGMAELSAGFRQGRTAMDAMRQTEADRRQQMVAATAAAKQREFENALKHLGLLNRFEQTGSTAERLDFDRKRHQDRLELDREEFRLDKEYKQGIAQNRKRMTDLEYDKFQDRLDQREEERKAVQEQVLKELESNSETASRMTSAADEAYKMLEDDNSFTSFFDYGNAGRVAALVMPGYSDAKRIDDLYETLRAQMKFIKIADLKEQSRTGATGLGQITAPEFKALSDAVAVLDITSSRETQRAALKTIREYLSPHLIERAQSVLGETPIGGRGTFVNPSDYTDDRIKSNEAEEDFNRFGNPTQPSQSQNPNGQLLPDITEEELKWLINQ
jgi:hypothetical protein